MPRLATAVVMADQVMVGAVEVADNRSVECRGWMNDHSAVYTDNAPHIARDDPQVMRDNQNRRPTVLLFKKLVEDVASAVHVVCRLVEDEKP